MALIPFLAMVRKDLLLFFSDRRSVIVSFVVPIAIASFFGTIFSGPQRGAEPARIAVAIIDQDGSAVSKGMVAGAQGDRNLKLTMPTEAEARDSVKRGRTPVAIVIPPGFGDASGRRSSATREARAGRPVRSLAQRRSGDGARDPHTARHGGGEQGDVRRRTRRATVEQTLPQIEASAMPADQKRALVEMLKSVQNFYAQPSDRRRRRAARITMPYTVREEAMTAGSNIAYNGYAHSFAGMAIQFLLFAMANAGSRCCSSASAVSGRACARAGLEVTLLSGKRPAARFISLMILLVSFAFAMIVFRVRIEGSIAGFLSISIACALMASTFGLLIAALGNSPATARGVTTLAVLMMVMLGGAWVPTFVFPAWMQQLTLVVPVRWAVDGLDAMTWRGIGLSGAIAPTLVLLGFALAFAAIAATRFRWEEGN